MDSGGTAPTYFTLVLDDGEWSASRPGRFISVRKNPSVPIVQEAGWSTETIWTPWWKRRNLWPTPKI
jgi:hypothetical protein